MRHEDDILEDALNSGLRFSATKHSLTAQEVYDIVKKFKTEINDLCSCEKARLRGVTMMCFMCDGGQNRIKL